MQLFSLKPIDLAFLTIEIFYKKSGVSLMWLNLRPSVTLLCSSTHDQLLQSDVVQPNIKCYSLMWFKQ